MGLIVGLIVRRLARTNYSKDAALNTEPENRPRQLHAPDATLWYTPRLALPQSTASLLTRLIDELDWEARSITLFGKTRLQPRLISWHADDGLGYRYSNDYHAGKPLTPLLDSLRLTVQRHCGHRFNSVLCNYYRDGSDSMGMHADDEPELGDEPVIASLSLGQERTLRFKHRSDPGVPDLRIELGDGSLLLMAGSTQRCWKHGIAKTRKPCGPRVNLTFRWIVAGA